MARGGKRQGKPGGGYTNRSDLAVPGKPLPVVSPKDQTYGQRTSLENAQRTVPMASQPAIPPARPAGPPGQPPGPMLAPPDPAGHLMNPTARPNEPVTAGLPSGPGPGPEAMTGLGQPGAPGNLADLLAQAAQASGSSALSFLAGQAQAQGQ